MCFFTICSFSLLFNVVKSDVGSYIYPQPLPPLQFDEPSTPAPIYLPPLQEEEYLPPPAPPSPTYLPPNVYPPLGSDDTIVVPAYPPQVRILNMSCMMDSFFRSQIRVQAAQLVVDNAPESCVVSDFGNTFKIDVEGGRMGECGVRRCKDGTSRTNLCITVRMPTVQRLRLPEDSVVTLQCTPQENIVSQVKHLRLNPNVVQNARSRSTGVVAAGGTQRRFQTKVYLLRKSPNGHDFDQQVIPGSGVQLGEELALKAAVQDGDGWQFSRIGSITIRSASLQKSMTLVDENGCRPASLKSICPLQPRQINPLVTVLNFRAFLFQESTRSDDMMVTVRILGCVQQKDCVQRSVCDDANGRFRSRRAVIDRQNNDTESEFTNWESVQFHVFATRRNDDLEVEETGNRSSSLVDNFLIILLLFTMMLFILVTIFVFIYYKC